MRSYLTAQRLFFALTLGPIVPALFGQAAEPAAAAPAQPAAAAAAEEELTEEEKKARDDGSRRMQAAIARAADIKVGLPGNTGSIKRALEYLETYLADHADDVAVALPEHVESLYWKLASYYRERADNAKAQGVVATMRGHAKRAAAACDHYVQYWTAHYPRMGEPAKTALRFLKLYGDMMLAADTPSDGRDSFTTWCGENGLLCMTPVHKDCNLPWLKLLTSRDPVLSTSFAPARYRTVITESELSKERWGQWADYIIALHPPGDGAATTPVHPDVTRAEQVKKIIQEASTPTKK